MNGWSRSKFSDSGVTHETFRKGSGPGVIIVHEIPGITPAVEKFANELNLPIDLLLKQLESAGIKKTSGAEELLEADKSALLNYLQIEHGASNTNKNKITITRKQNTQIRKTDSDGRARTIQVEVRKKRTIVKPEQRKEVKDLIAYFRLAVNPADEEAFKRVINYPIRGIGKTSLDKLIIAADEQNKTLLSIAETAAQFIGGKSSKVIEEFFTMIKSFGVMMKSDNAFEVANHIAKQTGLLKDLYDDKSIEGLSRYENIQELLNGIKDYTENESTEDIGLGGFLQDVALLTGNEAANEQDKDTNNAQDHGSSKR